MNNDKSKPQNGKSKPANGGQNPAPAQSKGSPAAAKSTPAAGGAPAVRAPRPKVPPLFRRIDWLALIVAFAVVWIAYLFMLAPDETLEDSGELCTGAFYAGIPHPPGYPFWSIYSYLWCHLPWGSVAWRVEVGESFAAALACGLVAFMVSRGSSMLIEGISSLKEMSREWESTICVVCGITAGLLLGFDDYMWKESVVINRISLFDVPWLMVVVLCLMRWIYAPHQLRYLYTSLFFFGLCATIHQTMLCAAMGIEVAIAMGHPRYGRTFFLGNSICFLGGLILINSNVIPAFNGLSHELMAIFGVVGVLSVVAYVWMAIITKESFNELCRDGALTACFLFFCAVPGQGAACAFLALVALVAFGILAWNTRRVDLGWVVVGVCAALWILGVSFYFYEAIAGMTNPPMEWGYPRTVEGFFHAISRGQYEQARPTNVLTNPGQFIQQLGMLAGGLANSFSWVNLFIGLLPFLFIHKMQKRERAWLVGLGAIYACVGLLLVILMDTTPDRQTAEENKVFFTASHAVIAIFIGYGLALLSAYMATHYKNIRAIGLAAAVIALFPASLGFYENINTTFFGGAGLLNYYTILALFFLLAAIFVMAALAVQRYLKLKESSSPDDRFIFQMLAGGAAVLLALCLFLAFFSSSRYDDKDSTGVTLTQIFASLPRLTAPHQYSLPVLGGIWVIGIVVAFIGALAAYRNRAPVAITLALFALTPGYSVMSHWAKCEQRNHWFGYWFGHDMFTPPFNIYPQMDRNTILFGGTDPGRFCPTYMIFCESFTPASCKPMDPSFDRRDCYLITQNALADNTYLDYLRAQYFRSAQSDPYFFCNLIDYVAGLAHCEDNPVVKGLSNAAYHALDLPFTARGAAIEKRWRAEGVYPPKEIYIPSPEDSEKAFRDYTQDAEQRREEGRLEPGEDVQVDPASGRVAVSGQVAVMMINGLLCKVIFDHNPTNSFYVEESFPLEWMYPYETPFGIIMKINRQPIETYPDEVFTNDHAFWSQYSTRLIGNWITYDTSVKQITDWVQKVYLQNDYSGYTGDLKFIRDEDGQKAFSKLRSSQAGMYAWRLHLLLPSPPYPPIDPQYLPYRPKSDAEVQKLYKECDFAFKQSFAFCPYSPEAVVRYCNFLFQFQRFDDALLVAETCHKLDPYNGQISDLIRQINDIKKQQAGQQQSSTSSQVQQMQEEARTNPANLDNIAKMGSLYQQYQPAMALSAFKQAEPYADKALADSNTSEQNLSAVVQIYAGLNELPKVQQALKRMAALTPNEPEIYYDLAAVTAALGQTSDALAELKTAMSLNTARLKANPSALNLLQQARSDPHFASISNLPEFKALVPPG
ncbi:MAG TPA: DUF2723 domain-containing protein [Verrucomicrobiae bacterium]|jgi:tetratricopeptide (TPR) repeat protein